MLWGIHDQGNYSSRHSAIHLDMDSPSGAEATRLPPASLDSIEAELSTTDVWDAGCCESGRDAAGAPVDAFDV